LTTHLDFHFVAKPAVEKNLSGKPHNVGEMSEELSTQRVNLVKKLYKE
jgi:hypothetical protein